MRREIAGRADDGRPLLPRHAHRHHVPFDELSEVDTRLESGADEIDPTLFGGGDVEHDVGVVVRELAQLRCEHHPGGQARGHETHASGRLVAKAGDLVQCALHIGERGPQTRDELLSRVGRGDAAGRPRQQAYANPLLESTNRMAQRGGRNAQPLRRPGETSFLCDRKKRRQDAELIANHC